MVREIAQAPTMMVRAATNENEITSTSWNGAEYRSLKNFLMAPRNSVGWQKAPVLPACSDGIITVNVEVDVLIAWMST